MELKALNSHDIKLMSESFLFKGLKDEAVLSFCASDGCSLAAYKKGDIIFTPESFLKSCGLILSGRVSVSKDSGDGRRLLMNTLGRGSPFGVAALWTEKSEYVTELRALEDCRIIFFSGELLETAIREYPEFAFNYIRFLSGRIRFLNDKIQGLISGSATASLRQYILRHYELFGSKFSLDGSISSLALKLNVSRASLYRAFGVLENEGIIQRSGRKIVITDLEKLGRFTE